jgi:hypothetical protein
MEYVSADGDGGSVFSPPTRVNERGFCNDVVMRRGGER